MINSTQESKECLSVFSQIVDLQKDEFLNSLSLANKVIDISKMLLGKEFHIKESLNLENNQFILHINNDIHKNKFLSDMDSYDRSNYELEEDTIKIILT